MTSTLPDPLNLADQTLAIRIAARQFTEALAAEAMLQATAHVEARLAADGAGAPFAVDEALAAAWPKTAGAPPRQEVIWSPGEAGGLRFSAFDAVGRVLLRRTYAAGAARKSPVERHV